MTKKKNYNEYCINDRTFKIYPNEYLLNNKFTRDEVDDFILDDDESYNLYTSFCVNAWKFIGRPESEEEALRRMIDDPDWFKDVTWTKEQRLEYEQIVHKILMNCLEFDSEEAWHEIEHWLALGSVPNLDDMSEENYRDCIEQENKLRGWSEEDLETEE